MASRKVVKARCQCGKSREWTADRLRINGWVVTHLYGWVCDYCVRDAIAVVREGTLPEKRRGTR